MACQHTFAKTRHNIGTSGSPAHSAKQGICSYLADIAQSLCGLSTHIQRHTISQNTTHVAPSIHSVRKPMRHTCTHMSRHIRDMKTHLRTQLKGAHVAYKHTLMEAQYITTHSVYTKTRQAHVAHKQTLMEA